MIRDFFNRLSGRWADLHPAGKILVLLAFIGIVSFFGLRPGYSVVRKWRLERNLTEAKTAVEDSRMDEARDLSLTVLRSGDPRVDAYRILERSTAFLRDPRHGEISRALIFHPGSTKTDRLRGFQGIVDAMPLGIVGQAWAGLPEEIRKDSRFATEFAGRLAREKRWNEAASVLLQVPEENRNQEWVVQICRVLIGTGSDEAYLEAQRMIVTTMEAGEMDRNHMLDVLEDIPVVALDPGSLSSVRKTLETNEEDTDARASLMLAKMDCRENFSSRKMIVDSAIDVWKDKAPERVMAFLCDMGLHGLLLEEVAKGSIPANGESFAYLLEAMTQTGNWADFDSLAEKFGGRLGKAERLGYKAIADAKSGESLGGKKRWNLALEEARASHTADVLLQLSGIAKEAEEPEFSEKAMIEAIRIGRGPLPLYSDLRPLLISLRQDERENILLEICAIYLSFEPGNPVLLTQYAYLAYFNGLAEAAAVLGALEQLAEAFPNEAPIQRVLAGIYVCDGRLSEAGEIFQKQDPLAGVSPPEYLMSFYISEVASGKMESNDTKISKFPMGTLLPSERKKFSELLRPQKTGAN